MSNGFYGKDNSTDYAFDLIHRLIIPKADHCALSCG